VADDPRRAIADSGDVDKLIDALVEETAIRLYAWAHRWRTETELGCAREEWNSDYLLEIERQAWRDQAAFIQGRES
jgi:hypothetical protein